MRPDKAQKAQASLLKRLARWVRSDRGNVTPLIAFLLVPIIGAFAIVTETSSWFMVQRSEQHAADSAVLAAATNGSKLSTESPSPGTADYEAKAVATRYGYTTGVDNTTVTVTRPACPSPWTGTCYKVDISKNVPLRLARLVGYNGEVALGAGRGKTLLASAIGRSGSKGTYCITAFGTADNAIEFNGGPSLNLAGCDIASAGGGSCNGHSGDTVGHSYVVAAGKTNDDCGPSEVVTSAPADIYRALKSNIPANPCSSYSTVQTLTGTLASTPSPYCGGVKLTGNVNVTGDVVITVVNGDFDTNGMTISTSGSGHLTIVLTGDHATSGTKYSHIFTGGGAFNFAAPTTGVWSGVAIYQDPDQTYGLFDINNAGNSPTYNVTGLLYLPNSNVRVSGAINHKTGGDNCMAMVVKTVLINGTGSIFGTPTSECDRAGLTLQGSAGSSTTPLLVQ